jgi:DNA-binding helix-hairpin-helix protein with protein kinase domain
MYCTIETVKIKEKKFYKFYLVETSEGKITQENDFTYIATLEDAEIRNTTYFDSVSLVFKAIREKKFENKRVKKKTDLVVRAFQKLYDEIRVKMKTAETKSREEEWKKENKKEQQDYFYGFNITKKSYTEKQKDYLRKIYKAAAMKLHPDISKDDGEGMKFLNKLKSEWDLQ